MAASTAAGERRARSTNAVSSLARRNTAPPSSRYGPFGLASTRHRRASASLQRLWVLLRLKPVRLVGNSTTCACATRCEQACSDHSTKRVFTPSRRSMAKVASSAATRLVHRVRRRPPRGAKAVRSAAKVLRQSIRSSSPTEYRPLLAMPNHSISSGCGGAAHLAEAQAASALPGPMLGSGSETRSSGPGRTVATTR